MTSTFKRGDIVVIAIPENKGHLIYGSRPHIVISNNISNKNAQTLNVIPLTSRLKKPLPTHVVINGYGLKKPSTVLTEQLYSVDKNQVIGHIGYISDKKIMDKIAKCLSIQLDVA